MKERKETEKDRILKQNNPSPRATKNYYDYRINNNRPMDNNIIGNIVTVTVDRPLGSSHPVHKELYYPINYGYVKGILAPDGEEQDAYILGVDVPVENYTGKVVAVIHRTNDVEEKWVVCPLGMTFTRDEIMEQVKFQEQYFKSEILVDNSER